tara:strand:- start:341 stop:586 length:246 start_codon:yes stop_codon:yes gene_type:complete
MKLPKPTRKNDKKQSLFESKQDVIDWLEYMLHYQDLSSAECMVVPSEEIHDKKPYVKVFVDEVIRKRYREMIDWLKSDQVA